MNIEKAIEINKELLARSCSHSNETIEEALKLGIEALKLHQERRQRFPNLPHLLLPGETEE